jgi:hypothetical protein
VYAIVHIRHIFFSSQSGAHCAFHQFPFNSKALPSLFVPFSFTAAKSTNYCAQINRSLTYFARSAVHLPHVALSPLGLPPLSCRRSICDNSSACHTRLRPVDSQRISRCGAVILSLRRNIFSLRPKHRGVNKGTASSLPVPAISPFPFDLTTPGLQGSDS